MCFHLYPVALISQYYPNYIICQSTKKQVNWVQPMSMFNMRLIKESHNDWVQTCGLSDQGRWLGGVLFGLQKSQKVVFTTAFLGDIIIYNVTHSAFEGCPEIVEMGGTHSKLIEVYDLMIRRQRLQPAQDQKGGKTLFWSWLAIIISW